MARGGNTEGRTSVFLRGSDKLTTFIREHLASDPHWGKICISGAWICPYCLTTVKPRGSSRSALVRSIARHLERCSGYDDGRGKPRPPQVILNKKRYQDILHLVLKDPAWQVYDHEGYWYSPCSLRRIEEVRIRDGRLDSETINAITNHLAQCPFYRDGVIHSVEEVQGARDGDVREATVATNIRRLLRYPIWRYTNSEGHWICPYCLDHVTTVVLHEQVDWEPIPDLMAQHMLADCQHFTPDSQQMQSEDMVRRSAAQPPLQPISPDATPRSGMRMAGGYHPTPPGSQNILPEGAEPLATPPVVDANSPSVAGPLPTVESMPQPPASEFAEQVKEEPTPLTPTSNESLDEQEVNQSENHLTDALSWMDAVEEKEVKDRRRHTSTQLVRARQVQKNLLQAPPEIPGFQFAVRFEACEEISGDFYDFIELRQGRYGIAQGDVSGHGMHAGLIMTMAKKTLSIIARLGHDATTTIAEVNDALVDDLGGNNFFSLVYGELDPATRTIHWVRAGHAPVIRFNVHSQEIEEINPRGMVVGMKGGAIFRNSLQMRSMQAQSGDLYLIYTDGITETMIRQGEEYGVERLCELVRQHAHEGSEMVLNRVMDSVRQFRGSDKPEDDATLLALTVE